MKLVLTFFIFFAFYSCSAKKNNGNNESNSQPNAESSNTNPQNDGSNESNSQPNTENSNIGPQRSNGNNNSNLQPNAESFNIVHQEDINLDSDGDRVSDKDELSLGRNPKVADIPEVSIMFLQDYSIRVQYETEKEEGIKQFTINTKTGRNNPDFQYRVGSVLIRNTSFKEAARVGRFASHSRGEIQEHDLSLISYPHVDARFYKAHILKYYDVLTSPENKNISASVTFENSIQLQDYNNFQEISNLSLNFYYYDHQRESFELLKTHYVNRIFQNGVNESFEVTLDNVPLNLIENYLKSGEFIISEINDFDIPELKTTYKNLLASVRSKSIPLVYNTPLESIIIYVGVNGKNTQFINILQAIFNNRVTIEEGKILKIEDFTSNLPDYTYLTELKDYDKSGKWFVFTNRIKRHYLDHTFTPDDIVSLSYVTGDLLARQQEEKIFSYYPSASTSNIETYALGNISANSQVQIQIKPDWLTGEQMATWEEKAPPHFPAFWFSLQIYNA